jgi:hypothetical protein
MADLVDERVVKRVKEITNKVYQDVTAKLGYSNTYIRIALIDDRMSEEEYREKTETIDTEYCKAITKLSSSTLEDIIKVHKSGQLKRAQRTLDAIITELLERELYGSRATENNKTE